jgi:hypothetical protein
VIDINIDSTALGSASCILRLKRTIIGEIIDGSIDPLGAYKSIPSASIIYGVAVHKFTDVMFKTGDFPLAREAARKAFSVTKFPPGKNQQHLGDERHLITTCYNLWTEYIEKESTYDIVQLPTGPATELTFRVLFYEDAFVRIWLCGTIDSIGKFKNGCFAIRDWKTTSMWDKDKYIKQYRLSRQLRIYTLACKLEAAKNPDSTLGRIGSTNMGAFIDAIFVRSKANENEYVRSDVYQYSEDDLGKFSNTLKQLCGKLSWHVQCNDWPKEGILNGTCEGKYECPFWNVCSVNDSVGSVLLARDFKRKNFDPLKYQDDN